MHFKNHQEYLQFFRQPPVEPREYIPEQTQETPKTADRAQEEASARDPEPEKTPEEETERCPGITS